MIYDTWCEVHGDGGNYARNLECLDVPFRMEDEDTGPIAHWMELQETFCMEG